MEEPRPPCMHQRGHQKLRASLGGEYERFPIRPPSGSSTIRMYVRSPLRRGSQAGTRTPARTTYYPPGDAHPHLVRGLRGRTYWRYAWVSFNTTM